jgi:hypothetical protein
MSSAEIDRLQKTEADAATPAVAAANDPARMAIEPASREHGRAPPVLDSK